MRTLVKLITRQHVGPPGLRYSAHWSDDTDFRHRGWGETEPEAVEDLKRLDDERAEAEEANGNA